MKRNLYPQITGMFFCFSLFFFQPNFLLAQTEQSQRISEYAEDNQKCFECHGQAYYYYQNDWIEKKVKDRMNPYFIIDSEEYYESNHWNFSCTDCHSADYTKFPHAGELRMEPKFSCMDCHEGDEQTAKFNFEQINDEFHKSVHSSKHSEEFTCWMCHNPHSYKINARTNENMADFIQYDNEICLTCHADISKYQLLTTLENPNVLETHSWLPNQVLHFKKVRCIECHTEISDDILVSHNVRPKEEAIKLCVECHSKESRLLASLYKYQFTNERSITGFSNKEMLEESYVIGANRNYYLNVVSIGLFVLVFIGLCIHAFLRIIIKH
jgi:Zn finger protein HypA/HybF involved in hydrogenase expression